MPETTAASFASFAIALPLYRVFDYAIDAGQPGLVGRRFRLPFGRASKTGLLLSTQVTSEVSPERIKPVLECLDDAPVLSAHMLSLAQWIADYYLQPPGEVLFQCLPGYLRSARRATQLRVKYWLAQPLAAPLRAKLERRSPRQFELLVAIEAAQEGLNAAELKTINPNWSSLVKALEQKDALTWRWGKEQQDDFEAETPPRLTEDQAQVYQQLTARLDHFGVHLLEGITGSGKTEVYLRLIEACLARQQQVIYLVPEIGLTSQLVERVTRRFGLSFAISHSGLTDLQRYRAWEKFRSGDARIMLGTRSSLFSQSEQLGLIIVDEEHDSSYKQEDGIRYHARDVAIKRAQMLDIPILLGSATPSLESLNNCAREHYFVYQLSQRPTGFAPPRLQLIDTRHLKMDFGCSPGLFKRIDHHLAQQGQVLIYLNRRGYAPVVMCHECSWQAVCRHCDARLTLHRSINRLQCHHCGYAQAIPDACPECGHGEIKHYGIGTQQLEQGLKQRYADIPVLRIDRDAITSRDEFARRLEVLSSGAPCLVIGTQMIAKGHDYPGITLSVILDADQALFSASYRASEALVQMAFQVSGRAGRGERQGEAVLQTSFPDHALVQSLTTQDYRELAASILAERRMLGFPPFARVVMFRADALSLALAMEKLAEIKQGLQASAKIRELSCIGPIPALMTRRIGRFRAQLCLLSADGRKLRAALRDAMPKIETIASTPSVKWVIDVDAFDL